MGDAFIYFFFIGSGTAAGVATVVFVSWRIYKRINKKEQLKATKKGVVRSVI